MGLDPITIGRYRVLGTLGEGAMGVVYLAEDPLLKRGVAIKVVHGAALARRDGLRRFQREAEISARLNHPNVVTVFDVGDEPGVGPFIAMEHVEGESLRERLHQGVLAPDEGIALLGQLRSGLEAAHRADIVHRDVKPENILVTKEGLLKLMDFGIAKDEDPAYTMTAAYLGTPAYAAPELLAGGRASAATDRWAFAVTAFECITGAAPFPGETISATLFLIAHESPRFPEGMAPAMRELFQRAFHKDPSKRPAGLEEFLLELVEVLPLEHEARHRARLQAGATLPSQLRTASLPAIRALADRRPWPRWSLSAGALLLAALLGGAWWWIAQGTARIMSIESEPPGALVEADGTPLGDTPLRNIRVGSGVRSIHLRKQGYLPLEHELGSEERKLVLALKAAPYRRPVLSEPEGAQVFLDGNLKGVTPMENLEIPGEGTHILKVEKAGYVPWITQTQPERSLPEPIQLQIPVHRKGGSKAKPEAPGKMKRFFSGLFKPKHQ